MGAGHLADGIDPCENLGLSLPRSWDLLLPFLGGFLPAAGVAMLLLRKGGDRLLKGMVKMVGAMLPVPSPSVPGLPALASGPAFCRNLCFADSSLTTLPPIFRDSEFCRGLL